MNFVEVIAIYSYKLILFHRFEEMTGAKIVGSVAGAFVLAFACDYIIADKKIFGGKYL